MVDPNTCYIQPSAIYSLLGLDVVDMTDKTTKLLELALEMELSRKASTRKAASEETLEDIYDVLVREVEKAS